MHVDTPVLTVVFRFRWLGKAGAHVLELQVDIGACARKLRRDIPSYNFLKLFPAVAVGGINLLKGFNGPFPDIQFCPTGGITIDSAPDFLKLPNVPVCGGTWLTPKKIVEAKDWKQITKLAKEASKLK